MNTQVGKLRSVALIVTVGSLLIACGSDGGGDRVAIGELASALRADSLVLCAFATNLSYAPGEPVHVFYFVVNGDSVRVFENSPELYRITVENTDGQSVNPTEVISVNRSWGTKTRHTLPAHGLLGRGMNLGCIEPGYGQSLCDYRYVLTEPGQYRLIITYDLFAPPDSMMITPMEELHLADTVQIAIERR